MSHVIIRGEIGRRHEVDFGAVEIMISLHTDIAVNGQQESSGDDHGQ